MSVPGGRYKAGRVDGVRANPAVADKFERYRAGAVEKDIACGSNITSIRVRPSWISKRYDAIDIDRSGLADRPTGLVCCVNDLVDFYGRRLLDHGLLVLVFAVTRSPVVHAINSSRHVR